MPEGAAETPKVMEKVFNILILKRELSPEEWECNVFAETFIYGRLYRRVSKNGTTINKTANKDMAQGE